MEPTIIIEHLEKKMWPWCKIEYAGIASIIPKDNLWFTNITEEGNFLSKFAKVSKESVTKIKLEDACILDPNAKKELNPKETKKFKYFIVGGILGDYPPKKRTKEELTDKIRGIPARNLGKKQFSTDNAVYVLKQIIDGTPLEKMKFQNKLTIKINSIESIDLPYYYPLVNGKPRISKALLKYIQNKKDF
ncbi:MAG: SAM-dependent methyltransferase [Candidatus Pacearchaeota archaeon]